MAVLPTGIGPVTGGYQIERSLRFNSADSAYLNRTPASAGNRRTWTWSGWVKRGVLLASNGLLEASTGGTNQTSLFFAGDDTLRIQDYTGGSYNIAWITTAVFRDPSAWYHIVVSYDTTQASSSNTTKIYVNGIQQSVSFTAYSGAYLQNRDGYINSTNLHATGRYGLATGFDGYLTEVNFIDGQALTPSSFGETDSATGVWKPKAYSSTYGTNGFYLKFADNSGTTSTTLGKDSSGNGNNWTPNNISVTAGAGNDSLVDSPTSYGTDTGVGGEVRGNYCTLNPLRKGASSSLANGNLDFTSTSSAGSIKQAQITGTIGIPASGKWYFECTPTTIGASIYIGVISDTHSMDSTPFSGTPIRTYRSSTGNKSDGGTDSAYGNTYTTNDVIGVAVNMDAGEIKFYKNGTVQNSGTAAFTNLAGTTWVPYCVAGSSGTTNNGNFNFGQRAFAYTAPSGFKALVTTNLPTPTIGATSTTQANDYFNTVLYTGTGSSLSVTGVGFQPDWVWIKERNAAADHGLYDAVRGVQKQLESNTTTAETTEATGLTAFGADGFTVGALAQLNTSADTYVAWNWNAGGSNATNTSGTITSTVRANTTSGFSIVTYTGTGSNATVGHGLGVAPKMVIVKDRTAASSNRWATYHSGMTNATYWMYLEGTAAQAVDTAVWNSTAPSSTVFSIGTSTNVGSSAHTYVAYCFAPVAGYSAFGSYTGNGSTDGPFVYTGFRPRWIMIKNATANSSSAYGSWKIIDTTRNTYNGANPSSLYANASYAEGLRGNGSADSFVERLDILSNGFKLGAATSYDIETNESGVTYIYAAFAETPFKYSLAR